MAVSTAELQIFGQFDRRPIVTPPISAVQRLATISTGVHVGRRFTMNDAAECAIDDQVARSTPMTPKKWRLLQLGTKHRKTEERGRQRLSCLAHAPGTSFQ